MYIQRAARGGQDVGPEVGLELHDHHGRDLAHPLHPGGRLHEGLLGHVGVPQHRLVLCRDLRDHMALRDRKMALNLGAHRPRHEFVARLMQGILRFRLQSRSRSRTLRAIFRPLRLSSVTSIL